MKHPEILERTIAYSVRIVNLCQTLESTHSGRILGGQLLRSGTSIGANIHEAQGGHSKADFIAKMTIAQKEAYESLYWMRVLQATNLLPAARLNDLFDETEQLVKIITTIIVNTKQRNSE